MEGYQRYAIYFAPQPGTALARFGAAWLGWDPEAARPVPRPDVPGLPRPVAALTAAPRRYGFHATLKAPFRLAPGRAAAELDAAVAVLAREWAAFPLPPLRLAAIRGFLALAPARAAPRLDALAAACVRRLDAFRAPMAAAERRRRAAGLSPGQLALLDAWGYPFVLSEFRFHLTLTGALAPDELAATAAALAPVLRPVLAEVPHFDAICIFGEPKDATPFQLIRRHPLARPGTGKIWSG